MFANASIHAEDDLIDTSLELTDKGVVLAAKMKIKFSLIPESGDNIKEFMKRVDDDVSHMSSLPSSLSTLRQVLKSTKAIMDRVSQVVHLSSLNLIISNKLIEVIRYTRYSTYRGSLFSVFTR
jgi:hypothetical protein